MALVILWKFILSMFVLNCFSRELFKRKEMVLKLDRIVGPCPYSHKLALEYRNVSHLVDNNGNLNINYTLVAKENLPDKKIKLNLNVVKCLRKESPDTCFNFFNFKTDRVCDMLKSKGQVWSAFTDCQHPKMLCPIKKNNYVATGCTLDVSKFKLFPLGDFYWKVNHSYYQGERLIQCAITHGYVVSRFVD